MLKILIPVIPILYTVIIEVFLQCLTESVSLGDLGKYTSRAEKNSPMKAFYILRR